jgi:hypothetical protein
MPKRRGNERRLATPEEARALSHPDRLRIIRLTFDAALTNKELAERLGRDPATTLHHVRTLVATGFLEPQEPRRGTRGAREIPYLSTGKSWTLEIGDPSDDRTMTVIDAFRAEVLEAPPDQRLWTRLALRLSPEQREELEQRLFGLLEEVATWKPVKSGEPWALFVAMHARPDAWVPKEARATPRKAAVKRKRAAS